MPTPTIPFLTYNFSRYIFILKLNSSLLIIKVIAVIVSFHILYYCYIFKHHIWPYHENCIKKIIKMRKKTTQKCFYLLCTQHLAWCMPAFAFSFSLKYWIFLQHNGSVTCKNCLPMVSYKSMAGKKKKLASPQIENCRHWGLFLCVWVKLLLISSSLCCYLPRKLLFLCV